MRPLALIQHDRTQRPGFLVQCLEQELGLPLRVFLPEQGDAVPRHPQDFSGIVLLGSNRSVHDPLPWIADEAALVRRAIETDVPVLGHCFGAQLMARAMGARVCRNACANIGWTRLYATPFARDLFAGDGVPSFNWHYDTFAIPQGAQRLLFGRHCLNKAFGLGPHLAFQCHFEVTEDIVRDWCRASADELGAAGGPAVQPAQQILAELPRQLPALRATARRVYHRWASRILRPRPGARGRHAFRTASAGFSLIENEVLPRVRQQTALTADASRTVLAGASYGGLASSTIALRRPEAVGNVLAMSGSFWWHPTGTPPVNTVSVAHTIATGPARSTRWFLAAGSFETGRPGSAGILETTRHVRDVLVARGQPVVHREYAAGHDDLAWQGVLADGLVALFGTR